MRVAALVFAIAALGTLVTSSSAARPKLRLQVGPAALRVAVPVPITVRGPFRNVRVEAASPAGQVVPIEVRRAGRDAWHGLFRFDRVGRWQVVARSGALRVRVVVVIRPGVPTPPPKGFGPLGGPGCMPPSPRNADAKVYGTTVGSRFWAVVFRPAGTTWASDATASLEGLVGKETKIAFTLTAGFPSRFYAVAPDGSKTRPVAISRPAGNEWLARFVFGQIGCWRIHASRGAVAGDIWLDVRS